MAVDPSHSPSGYIWVADYGNSQVVLITPGGGLSSFNGNGNLGFPRGIAVDLAGNVYVADPPNNNIYNLTTQTIFAGSYTAGAANGTGAAASFNSPTGVATDAQGNVYGAVVRRKMLEKHIRLDAK